MTVIFAEDVAPSVRGMLKRWFVEPRPNVFVGSVNVRTREKTLNYIRRNAPDLNLLVVYDEENSQGFSVRSYGCPTRRPVSLCGLTLIAEPCESDTSKIEDVCCSTDCDTPG